MKSGMEKKFTQSRAWITRESPTLAEILSEYLRFLDMPSLWEANIIPKLKPVAAMQPRLWTLLKGIEDKTEDEACYIMLVLLTHLLPPVGVSRCSAETTITYLLDFVPPGTE
ncbi:hypothetical protein XENORESO_014525 [Xenotaenia resolanae]|uniref:Uncharacterized protein n=1 Tax=Xenotaenia resolanae TaxID=208358 RepID=A0ABV0VQV2_9TELE